MLSALLVPLLLQALLLSSVSAAPIGLRIPKIDPKKILCQLSFVERYLCPEGGLNALSRVTPFGTASGVLDPDGAHRYPVRYASAARWAPSTLVNSWELPNGSNNVSALPLACPQNDVSSSAYSEDCLSMVLYVPPSLNPLTSNAPVLVWIHGGSFVVGSATSTGIDGSKLALATNSIVVVPQYRLGALGLLAPSGNTNLAVKDVVNALEFVKRVAPSFGGSASKVTLAGQSAGASMIRAILSAPSASSLFRSVILHSDPINFGHLRPSIHQAIADDFKNRVGCSSASCQNGLSLSSILSAQQATYEYAVNNIPAAGTGQPIRPVLDGTFITTPFDTTAPFPSINKPLLVTSVENEAAWAIFKSLPPLLDEGAFPYLTSLTFGNQRTSVILDSPFYTPAPGSIVDGKVDGRFQLEKLGTDYLWKCAGWTFSRAWVQAGSNAYVGQFVVGATYPGNEEVARCTQNGVVCHQDDIQIVFGTVANPTAEQSALTSQIQQRYKAFLNNGNPNAAGLPTWTAATTTDVHALRLGGTGEADVGACDPSFWGSSVDYDYQFYN
ncbi:hypothetical protein H1R20_g9344, partial [Candolleomyces eurysporus]